MSDIPKALRYADALASAEERIVVALPGILDLLIGRARAGDAKVAIYLCDRVMGRTAGAKLAPVDDRQPPLTADAFRLDEAGRQSRELPRRIVIPGSDPRPRATESTHSGARDIEPNGRSGSAHVPASSGAGERT